MPVVLSICAVFAFALAAARIQACSVHSAGDRPCFQAIQTLVHLSLTTALMRVGWTMARVPLLDRSLFLSIALDAVAVLFVTLAAYVIGRKRKGGCRSDDILLSESGSPYARTVWRSSAFVRRAASIHQDRPTAPNRSEPSPDGGEHRESA